MGRQGRINWTFAEEHLLFLDWLKNRLVLFYICLWSILYADIAQSENNLSFILKNQSGISSTVHYIYLSNTTDGPFPKRIDLHGLVQDLIISDILISWNHTENDGGGISHILFYHLCSDLVDICGLTVNGYSG